MDAEAHDFVRFVTAILGGQSLRVGHVFQETDLGKRGPIGVRREWLAERVRGCVSADIINPFAGTVRQLPIVGGHVSYTLTGEGALLFAAPARDQRIAALADRQRPGTIRDVLTALANGENLTASGMKARFGRKLTNLKADAQRLKGGDGQEILSLLNKIPDR